ncbi:MAG: DUF4340 domain-containing protein [Candidatus Synoicihabitans palmerolidicus]|nr:DUF4340 domain-containing protein [Candidatus Synoicihabitans palmerolidicus]
MSSTGPAAARSSSRSLLPAMRTKVTLILVFINIALFFFIFGFERKGRTEEFALDARSRVLGPETANIQTLSITGPSLVAPITLHRTGVSWQIMSPYEWPANPFAMSRILSELQFLEHETSFPVYNLSATDISLADYGLAEPTLSVSFSSAADTSSESAPITTLAIGKKTEIGNRLYVLSPDGKRIHVVSQSLSNALALDLNQLRAAKCFTIPVYQIRALNIQNASPANIRVRLRREGNRWSFESPIVTRASTTATETALTSLISLQTSNFIGSPATEPDIVAVAGTNTPGLRITLESTNRRETLLIGNPIGETAIPSDTAVLPDHKFYARMEDRDAIFTIILPHALNTKLRNAQRELRDPLVLDLANRVVDTVTLSAPGRGEVVLQKLESTLGETEGTLPTWQIVQRDSTGTVRQPADRDVVEGQLLRDLTQLRATTFERDVPTKAELETWGLTSPDRTISLSFEPEVGTNIGAGEATLLIGTDQAGDRAFAKLQRQTFVYGIDRAVLAAIPVDPLHYRQRVLRDLPEGARLIGITLRDLNTSPSTLIYSHELAANETWADVFAHSPIAQRSALADLRQSLRILKAQRFIQDQFTDTVIVNGETRGWRFRLDAKLSLTGDSDEQIVDSTLFIADRDGGDLQLVGTSEFNVIYEAPQPFIDAIWTLSYAPRDPGPIEFTTPPPGAEDPPAETTPTP